MSIKLFGLICLVTTICVVPTKTLPFDQNKVDISSNGADLLKIVDQANQFGMQLLSKTAMTAENLKNDVILSSPSIFILLSLLYKASVGKTRDEIERVLFSGKRYQKVEDDITRMLSSMEQLGQEETVMLVKHTLTLFKTEFDVNETFVRMAKKSFGAEVHRFADMDELKSKIEQFNTNLPVPNERAKFFGVKMPTEKDIAGLLYNLVYFKAPWAAPFDADGTIDAEFLVDGDRSGPRQCVAVPMMNREIMHCSVFEDESGVTVFTVPFFGDRLAFYVAMPTERVADLGQVHKFIQDHGWKNISKMVEQQYCAVRLPKFEIEADHNLKEVLAKLGIRMAFTEGAQFPNIGHVKVSEATQKAFLKIDENGAEAGATSEFTAWPKFGVQELLVDRPFGFAIVDQVTGLALFQGVFRGQKFTDRRDCEENEDYDDQ